MLDQLLLPWQLCQPGLEGKLQRELSGQHPLWKVKAVSVARRVDNDDVLFELQNHSQQLAVVHLT